MAQLKNFKLFSTFGVFLLLNPTCKTTNKYYRNSILFLHYVWLLGASVLNKRAKWITTYPFVSDKIILTIFQMDYSTFFIFSLFIWESVYNSK